MERASSAIFGDTVRPSSNSRAPTAAANLGREHQTVRRKAPREHCGKCGGRARQPRGQLTGCLWELPPSIRLPRKPRTAPLRRLPPHRSPWRRQFGARHPGSTAENAAAGRGNPGVHSPGVCGMCPQPPLAAAAAHRPAQALATCSPAKRPAPKIAENR
jgi:hypothetical protein